MCTADYRCRYGLLVCSVNSHQNSCGVNCGQLRINCSVERRLITLSDFYCCLEDVRTSANTCT